MSWEKVYTERSEFEKACQESGKALRGLTYREAIKEAQTLCMEQDPSVFIMGEGVDDAAGVFGTTAGLQKRFGKQRVIDTPIAENTITGVAAGAALAAMRPVLVHMRMDFLLSGMDQTVNHLSKWSYMFGGRVKMPVVIRTIVGRGWGSAAQHSQSLQGLLMHIPGLKIALPATPYDMKGLLIESLRQDAPVVCIEHRLLYEHIGYVPEGIYTVEFGKGAVRKEGRDATVVGISYMAYEAVKAATALLKEGIDVEVIDIRTLNPLDENLIYESVKKTGRLVIADTSWLTAGAAAEIAARVACNAFAYLKAPIMRVCSPDCPTPASPVLEQLFYPTSEQIAQQVRKIVGK
jgi:acetoin:2,6-dichlorophenolindophenol oxidoreductase subunit beta